MAPAPCPRAARDVASTPAPDPAPHPTAAATEASAVRRRVMDPCWSVKVPNWSIRIAWIRRGAELAAVSVIVLFGGAEKRGGRELLSRGSRKKQVREKESAGETMCTCSW